ncbi:MAG: hypothetical protein HFG54_01785 [Lachnospiraceae bacterium]|nr:hypothetical protein [Lachnospiraceae bacterium]
MMDEKRLKQEYRNLRQQAAPDLWDRIESSLKDHPERVREELFMEKEQPVRRLEEGKKRAGRKLYGMAAIAAAMLALMVTVPRMTKEKGMGAGNAVPEANQEFMAAATTDHLEAVQETAVDAGSGMSGAKSQERENAVCAKVQEESGEMGENMLLPGKSDGLPEGVIDYQQLQLAAYQPITVPENALTIPEDFQYFSEAILKDTQLLCGGTVTGVSLEEDSSGRAVKVVYEMSLNQVYYAEDYTTGMDQIIVKSPIVKTDGDEVYILYQLQQGGTYLLPLWRQEGEWELLYPFAPQIQVTGDGAYLFHSGYASLVNDTTDVVLGSQEGENDYYYDRMVLRYDEDFISDLLTLVGH